jgi:hypothetical protein
MNKNICCDRSQKFQKGEKVNALEAYRSRVATLILSLGTKWM